MDPDYTSLEARILQHLANPLPPGHVWCTTGRVSVAQPNLARLPQPSSPESKRLVRDIRQSFLRATGRG